ncbi:MAG TPA: NAD(P)/FAD-dependent oxidoreductase [Candidatus Acidoferrum sp.]|nr:NAD(P)/FAD-dependent oxidoreductase [Candidatus Acidoferrum sp.]
MSGTTTTYATKALHAGALSDNFAGMNSKRIVIAGGGAAGFFAALACAETAPGAEIIILEKTSQFLSKVKISGGGRCNVTHADFDPREFSKRYPRGERTLISAFGKFQARDTVAWFENQGVKLKVESDGRMFPTTDSSQTIIDCLLNSTHRAGIKLKTNCGVETAEKKTGSKFELTLSNGEHLTCDKLLLATGGCRTPALGQLAVSLGHRLEPPVPSLFTFHVAAPWLKTLTGISVERAEASVAESKLRERGPLLITHWGLSGPVILRLSAWGARELHAKNYSFSLCINWLPALDDKTIADELEARRNSQPAKLIVNSPLAPLPARLWEQLILAAGLAKNLRWSGLSRASQHQLIQQLLRSEFHVTGKSLNKDEFVTCGGVKLSEVNFKTMESRICPGLFFAGEVLDIDGITGGFNFQSAWTTGWLAGKAMGA